MLKDFRRKDSHPGSIYREDRSPGWGTGSDNFEGVSNPEKSDSMPTLYLCGGCSGILGCDLSHSWATGRFCNRAIFICIHVISKNLKF